MRYINYHKHTYYSNIMTPDCVVSIEDYAKRAKELGHTTLSALEHGYAGNIFEYYTIAQQYDLKMIFGMEYYYVNDRHEKDRNNTHLLVMAKNPDGMRQMNSILSEANKTGYYYKARIDKELLLSLNPNNVIVTTACIGGYIGKHNDYETNFVEPLLNHFGNSFFLEIQDHVHPKQIEHNKKLIALHNKYKIPFIHANDSHYIYSEQSKDRDDLLKGKNINYPDEDGFILDYPDSDTIYRRYKKQGIFTEDQVTEALRNTLIMDNFEDIHIDKEIKMPSIYPGWSHKKKFKKLVNIVGNEWLKDKKYIDPKDYQKYQDAIKFELKIVRDTKMEDYFLLNSKIVKRARELGGILTRTGRGSGPSFYINKLLGFTEVDRLAAPITLYPTRFMSKSRILETRSLPDLDFNTVSPQPFRQATREILGDDNIYWMVAYGKMKESEAFRNYCRSKNMQMQEYNEVAKNLDAYRNDPRWGKLIDESKKFIGVVDSISPHPCFLAGELVMTDRGYKPIEDINYNDKVLTHQNTFEPVIKKMINNSNNIYDLKISGIPSTKVTGNHPYYVRQCQRPFPKIKNGKTNKVFTKPKWINVENLKKDDYIGIAINQKNIIPKGDLPFENKDFWWVVGRYIGDGWYKNLRPNNDIQGEYNTIICYGKSEVGEIEEHLDRLSKYFHYFRTEERTVYRINILSKKLWMFIKQFGKGARKKRLTNDVFDLPASLLKSFIDGYISADGYINKDLYSITTTSKQLAYGISACINKAYHRHTMICLHKCNDSILEGRLLKGGDTYIINFTKQKKLREQSFYENGYIWTPFRSKKKLNIIRATFNLEVRNEHTYTVNNAIVHNCSNVITSKPISKELGVIRVGDTLCALIDSHTSDDFKFLKNDYLTVSVWAIISDTFKLINKPIPDVRTLSKLLEHDDKVWKLYQDGITVTLNQTGSNSGIPQIMQYKPKNIRELSEWVAAIRPAFASMKSYFLNRKPFSYHIPAFDKLLQSSDNFILFQEDIMKTLVYVGFPEDKTYSMIKAIAKKKKGIIEPIHDKFIKGFTEKTGNAEDADKVWQIIQDAVGYGFNSSHAYSVALDSLYGAYLKVHYPIEYYTVVFKLYDGDTTMTAKLLKELSYFQIKLLPPKYGYSKGEYFFDKEKNSIYKGIGSIKFLNNDVGENLYELSNKLKFDTFTDLIFKIHQESFANFKQLKILAALNFFDEFGNNKKLLGVIDKYESRLKNKNLKDTTKQKRLDEVRKYEASLDNKKLNIRDQVKYEMEYYGYEVTKSPTSPKNIFMVTEINTKYTPRLRMYNFKTGRVISIKCRKQDMRANPFGETSIIKVQGVIQKFKNKLIDGKWTKTDEREPYLTSWSVIE